MGAVTFSLDPRLVDCLQSVLPLRTLVETGTYEGDTIAATASRFDHVHSVEIAREYHAAASTRFATNSRVQLHLGSSPDVLTKLRPDLQNESTLYWLDSHWCAEVDADLDHAGCPLLDELAAIGTLEASSVVLIDDARFFLAPPPAPHDLRDWPSLTDVLDALRRLAPDFEVMVVNDVLAVFPGRALDAMQLFGQAHGLDLLATLHCVRELEQERERHLAELAERLRLIETLDAAAKERLALIEELSEKLHGAEGGRA